MQRQRKKVSIMTMKRIYLNSKSKPTEKNLEEIRNSVNTPIVYDDDCPEITEQQYAEMAQLAKARRHEEVKQVIAIRISPSTLKKAKATGRGYTGFLSRLLDNAINDPDLVAKSL